MTRKSLNSGLKPGVFSSAYAALKRRSFTPRRDLAFFRSLAGHDLPKGACELNIPCLPRFISVLP